VNQERAMKEWRQNQKRRYTDVVLSRLDMKGTQKEEAHFWCRNLISWIYVAGAVWNR